MSRHHVDCNNLHVMRQVNLTWLTSIISAYSEVLMTLDNAIIIDATTRDLCQPIMVNLRRQLSILCFLYEIL